MCDGDIKININFARFYRIVLFFWFVNGWKCLSSWITRWAQFKARLNHKCVQWSSICARSHTQFQTMTFEDTIYRKRTIENPVSILNPHPANAFDQPDPILCITLCAQCKQYDLDKQMYICTFCNGHESTTTG